MKHLLLLSSIFLLVGCYQQPKVQHHAAQPKKKVQENTKNLPPAPKKEIELQEVDDTNFSSDYMYPDSNKKPEKIEKIVSSQNTLSSTMTDTECIAMIGQEKFDKYAAMYGGSAAAIKKCKMLKAL